MNNDFQLIERIFSRKYKQYHNKACNYCFIEIKSISLGIEIYKILFNNGKINFYWTEKIFRETYCGIPVIINYKRKNIIRLNLSYTKKYKDTIRLKKHKI